MDVVPFKPLPPSVARIVADYAWMTPLEKPTLFSGVNSTLEKILFLAEYAGPLDRFKYLVEQFIDNELANTPPLLLKSFKDSKQRAQAIEQHKTERNKSAILFYIQGQGEFSLYGNPRNGIWTLRPIDSSDLKVAALLKALPFNEGMIQYRDERCLPLINTLKQGHAQAGYNELVDRIFILGDNYQNTLMGCLVSRLDVTYRTENGTEIDEGMADCFATIVKTKLPHRYPDVITQARAAAPIEDETTRKQRESANLIKIERVFNVFTREAKDDKHIQQAINGCSLTLAPLDNDHGTIRTDLLVEANKNDTPVLLYIKTTEKFSMAGDPNEDGNWVWTELDLTPDQIKVLQKLPFNNNGIVTITRDNKEQFTLSLINILKKGHGSLETLRDFVENTKNLSINNQGYMQNNLFLANINDLIAKAFGVLSQRGNELPGEWYGKMADSFCFEIGILQVNLRSSPREMQILNNKGGGLYAFLNNNKKALRYIDVHGAIFLGVNSKLQLGVNCFFGIFGWPQRGAAGRARVGARREFSKLITSNYVSIQTLCDKPSLHNASRAAVVR